MAITTGGGIVYDKSGGRGAQFQQALQSMAQQQIQRAQLEELTRANKAQEGLGGRQVGVAEKTLDADISYKNTLTAQKQQEINELIRAAKSGEDLNDRQLKQLVAFQRESMDFQMSQLSEEKRRNLSQEAIAEAQLAWTKDLGGKNLKLQDRLLVENRRQANMQNAIQQGQLWVQQAEQGRLERGDAARLAAQLQTTMQSDPAFMENPQQWRLDNPGLVDSMFKLTAYASKGQISEVDALGMSTDQQAQTPTLGSIANTTAKSELMDQFEQPDIAPAPTVAPQRDAAPTGLPAPQEPAASSKAAPMVTPQLQGPSANNAPLVYPTYFAAAEALKDPVHQGWSIAQLPNGQFTLVDKTNQTMRSQSTAMPGSFGGIGLTKPLVPFAPDGSNYDPLRSPNFARGSGQRQMSPQDLARHEATTGDVHYPALIGVKEGIVNAKAMQAGGDKIVKALNRQYPVYANGKSGGTMAPQEPAAPEVPYKPRPQYPWTQAMTGAGPGPLQPYTDELPLDGSGVMSSDERTALENTPGTAYNRAAAAEAVNAATVEANRDVGAVLRQAAANIQASSKAPGAKKAVIDAAFGEGLKRLLEDKAEAVAFADGTVTDRYRGLVQAKRDMQKIGNLSLDAFRSMPLEQRQLVAKGVKAALADMSPALLAGAGPSGLAMANARDNEEARKIATLQATAQMMAASSKDMTTLLAPLNQAISNYKDAMSEAQDAAKTAKVPIAKYLYQNPGSLNQLNQLAQLIETFSTAIGNPVNMQMDIKKGGFLSQYALMPGAGANAPSGSGGPANLSQNGVDLVNQYSYTPSR